MSENQLELPPVISPTKHGLACEKCRGPMKPGKVFRLSRSLVFIGFTILIPSFLVLLVLLFATLVGVLGTKSALQSQMDDVRSQAVASLQKIDGLPKEFVTAFATDPATAPTNNIPEPLRPAVQQVLNAYNLQRVGTAIGGGGAAVFGGAILIVGYFITVPVLIVGFLLTLRKKVWRCLSCGFIFDRA